MALALTLRRGILLHHELQRRDPPAPWRSFHHPMIRRLGMQTFGIIGLGRIGTAVALRGQLHYAFKGDADTARRQDCVRSLVAAQDG